MTYLHLLIFHKFKCFFEMSKNFDLMHQFFASRYPMNWVQWLRDGISTPLWRRFSLCPSSVIEKISYITRFSRRILDRHPLPRTSRGWIYFRLLPFMEKISLIMRFSCQFFLSSPPPRDNRVCNYFFILLTFMEKISLMTRFSRQFFFLPPLTR